MEKFSYQNVNAVFHYAVSYCVLGKAKYTAIDFPTASLDIERERIYLSDGEFLTRLRLTNTSGNTLRLAEAYPIMCDNMSIGDMPSSMWRVFNGSRQLNDVPASCILGERDYSFFEASDRLGDEGFIPKKSQTGDSVLYGDGITIIRAGKTYVSLEILTNENQLTDISISVDENGDVNAIRLGGEFNCLLDKDDSTYTDWVRVSVGGNFLRLLDNYAEKRSEMGYMPLPSAKKMVYTLCEEPGLDIINERLSFLRGLKAPFDFMELGGKWYDYIGDWNEKPGINLSYISGIINKSGYKTGVRILPFLAEKDSELYNTEKDWFLRHGDGTVCTYEIDSETYAVLDISCDQCLEWIIMLFKQLSARGIYMHHVDHTIAFMLQKDVILHNPKVSMTYAYRNAMQAIASALGTDGHLYVTNGFLPCLGGVADTVAISSDMGIIRNKAGSSNILSKITNQCAMRAYTSYWWNCSGGRGTGEYVFSASSPEEKKRILVCQYLCGTPSPVGDISSNDKLKVLRYLYPFIDTKTYPRDLFCDDTYVSVVDVEVNNSYHTVCFFNNSFSEIELSFRLNSNLCGGYIDHASDYNISAYFNRNRVFDCRYDQIIKLGKIPANSCEIVKIAKNDKPGIVLSDMHFSMGGEVSICTKENSVVIEGNNFFNCRGNYVVALPAGFVCSDGRREFSFTVNGEGQFVYEKQIKRLTDKLE